MSLAHWGFITFSFASKSKVPNKKPSYESCHSKGPQFFHFASKSRALDRKPNYESCQFWGLIIFSFCIQIKSSQQNL